MVVFYVSEFILRKISEEHNAVDALDLAERAADYVTLEMGYAPNMAYIHDFFTAVPPGLTQADLHTFAIMQDEAMTGIICLAQGYEYPTDWWIGLMLLDPAYRGRGHGHTVIEQIKAKARDAGMMMLKLSVLNANPRALKFWGREGFVLHRHAPATPESDGHDRVVLKYHLEGG